MAPLLVARPTKSPVLATVPVDPVMAKVLVLALDKDNLNPNNLPQTLTGALPQTRTNQLPFRTHKTPATRPTTTHPSSIPSHPQTLPKTRPTIPLPAQIRRSPLASHKSSINCPLKTAQPTTPISQRHPFINLQHRQTKLSKKAGHPKKRKT